MRNLKRVLSLALASVMVVSMMVIGAGAANFDDFSDKDEIVNKEAVSVLVELGVLAGKDDGSYDPTGIITRGEMAKIICVVLNKGQDPNLGSVSSNTYTDTVGHWAAPYIEYCTNLNIVAGKGDGTFAPNDTVTASEASKMLLVALGYNAQFESMVGSNWAVATNVLANRNGLYDGLTLDVSAGLTRDNAAQMMYNALDAKVVEYEYAVIPSGDSISSIATAKYRDGEPTMLEYVFDAVKVTGIVLANEYGTVDNTKNAQKEGETWIKVTNNTTSNPEQSKLGDGKYNFATDMDLLGKKIDFYAIPGTSSVPAQAKILGSAIVSSENTVVTLTSGGTKSIEDRLKSEDMKVAGATYVTNYTEFDKFAGTTKTVNGVEIVAIDNDDDGVADYVLQNFEVFGKVTSYNTKDDGTITISAPNAETGYSFWDGSEGVKTYSKKSVKMDDAADVIGFEDVAKDDYVFVQEICGKLYVRKAEAVELTPSSTQGDNFKADGTTYKKAGTMDKINEAGKTKLNEAVEIGEAANVYLDAYGYVVYITDVDTTLDYLYITSVSYNEVDGARAKVVFADGSTDTITVSKLGGEDVTGIVATEETTDNELLKDEIYSYTVSGGKYKLTAVEEKSVTQIKKGNAEVGTKIYADDNTVFVVKTKSSWEVYTGINNVPDLKDITAVAACVKDTADVIFVTASDRDAAENLANSIYVLNENPTITKGSDGEDIYTYTVIYKGEKVEMKSEKLTLHTDDDNDGTGLYLDSKVTNNMIDSVSGFSAPVTAKKAESGVIVLNGNVGSYGDTFSVNSNTVFLAVDGEDVTVVDLGYITTGVDYINIIPDKDNNKLAAYVFILE